MKARTRKKRKKQAYIDGLERGNQYYADLIGRLIKDKNAERKAFDQLTKVLEGYMMVLVNDAGGEVGIDKEVLDRMMEENYMVYEKREDGSIWFTVLEHDEEEQA